MASWPTSTLPLTLVAEEYKSIPDSFRHLGSSDHSRNQKRGRPLDCFIEGPIVVGNDLYITDIPYGRIFAVDLITDLWRLVVEYEGEPNGLAWHSQRQQIIIADFKMGLLALNITTNVITPIMTRFNGEAFKGLNDVIVASDGTIFFTDQGMSGLHDPTGRVYRLAPDGRTDVLLHRCPSPNGLVLNKKEDSLFVAMTRDNSVWHVPLYSDGSVQRAGRFSTYFGIGGPDGMTLDTEGNVFVAHSTLGTVYVHKPNGEPLARILSSNGNGTTNLTWDLKDKTLLYITESETGTILRYKWHCEGWLRPENSKP